MLEVFRSLKSFCKMQPLIPKSKRIIKKNRFHLIRLNDNNNGNLHLSTWLFVQILFLPSFFIYFYLFIHDISYSTYYNIVL